MILLDIFVCLTILIVGFNLKKLFKKLDKKDYALLNKIFIYHFLIAVVFSFYILYFGGDAIHYWETPKELTIEELVFLAIYGKSGTVSIAIFNYLPSRILGLSFFTGNMMYALLGYLGFIYFLILLKSSVQKPDDLKKIKIAGISVFPLLFFLPNLHFWSSGIGKDSILFLMILMFMYGLRFKRKTLIFISLLFTGIIRPHITLFLLLSFAFAFLLDKKLKGYQKFLLFTFFILGFLLSFNYVAQFVNLGSLDSESIDQFVTTRSESLNTDRSSSGVDISGYPYLIKVFTFLFRPLFFDINNIIAIIASFENLFLLILAYRVFKNKIFLTIKKSSYLIKGMFFYCILGSATFPLILGNLGIMLRQKNMFTPIFLIVCLSILYRNTFNESITRN